MTDEPADRRPGAPPAPPTSLTADQEPLVWLDERGALCPLPVIALARAQRAHPPGTVVALLADDPAAATDVPAWCRMRGATLLQVRPPRDGGPGSAFVVRLPPEPAR